MVVEHDHLLQRLHWVALVLGNELVGYSLWAASWRLSSVTMWPTAMPPNA